MSRTPIPGLPRSNDTLFPARFKPERLKAWRWRATSLGGLVLNALLYEDDAIVNPLSINLPSDMIHDSLRFIRKHGPSAHSTTYLMHVGDLESARHFSRNQRDGGNYQVQHTLHHRQKAAGMPHYFGPAVIMGLMEEVPTYDSAYGINDETIATIQHPYPLAAVDKHTQELVERIAAKFDGPIVRR